MEESLWPNTPQQKALPGVSAERFRSSLQEPTSCNPEDRLASAENTRFHQRVNHRFCYNFYTHVYPIVLYLQFQAHPRIAARHERKLIKYSWLTQNKNTPAKWGFP